LFEDDAESIHIQINQEAFDIMLEEALLWPDKETGGMMFGQISLLEISREITILKTHIPQDDFCTRKRSFFGIDPDYAKKIVDAERLQYLGNWHKHLGYGGPSQGDLRQIDDFFNFNHHLNTIITFILDFYSEDEYQPIIEVYKRLDSNNEGKEKTYDTYRVPKENISFIKPKGLTKKTISLLKKELVEIKDYNLTLEQINDYEGHILNEKIVSFPYQFEIEASGKKQILNLSILMSFPPEFPDGEIFIDISSQDLSRNITFEKHPAGILNDSDLIQPFLLSLKASLDNDVVSLLQKPLWKVMQSSM